MFRNDTTDGTGVYVRVDDAIPALSYYGIAHVNLYETMSDVDTGTGLAPTTTTDARYKYHSLSSTSTNTTEYDWICVADNRTFYFVSSGSNADTGSTGTSDFFKSAAYSFDVWHFWAGDFDSYLNTDGYASFIAIFNSQSASPTCYSNTWSNSFVATNAQYVKALRGIDRTTNAAPINIITNNLLGLSTPGSEGNYNVGIRDNLSNDYTSDMNSQYIYREVFMGEYITTSQGVIRGKFRGLINGPFLGNSNSAFFNYSGETKTVDSRDLIGMRADLGSGFWVETTTDSWS